jgi:hypothetical protein
MYMCVMYMFVLCICVSCICALWGVNLPLFRSFNGIEMVPTSVAIFVLHLSSCILIFVNEATFYVH